MSQKFPKNPIHKSALPDLERYQLQEKMRNKANKDLAKHALIEWTLVRSLAWAERMIAIIAALLFFFDADREFLSLSGVGFVIVSLSVLGPVYGIIIFLSLLLIYEALKKLRMFPTSSKGFRKVIYPTYAAWFPLLYVLSFHAMNLYYELLKTFPIVDKIKALWNHH